MHYVFNLLVHAFGSDNSKSVNSMLKMDIFDDSIVLNIQIYQNAIFNPKREQEKIT